MNWDAVNGVTGLVSAACAVLGVCIQQRTTAEAVPDDFSRLLPRRYMASFLLVSSGWALCSLCFLLIFEPFGSYVSDRDYIKFYGVVLSVPALLILRYGVALAKRDEAEGGEGKT